MLSTSLVCCFLVFLKTYDAVVGDIYNDTSKAIKICGIHNAICWVWLVNVGSSQAWPSQSIDICLMFLRPFTVPMWLLTLAILLYTMFIVWIWNIDQKMQNLKGRWKINLARLFGSPSLLFSLHIVSNICWAFIYKQFPLY